MKLLGTIDEWLEYKPEAYLTNGKFLQKGTSIHGFKKYEEYTKPVTYHASRPYEGGHHSDPMIFFGSQCPYVCKGIFLYSTGVVYWPAGCGGEYYLSDSMANDPGWYEYDLKDYEEHV